MDTNHPYDFRCNFCGFVRKEPLSARSMAA